MALLGLVGVVIMIGVWVLLALEVGLPWWAGALAGSGGDGGCVGDLVAGDGGEGVDTVDGVDPRQNLDAVHAYLERAGVVSCRMMAFHFGMPYWQMYRALCHLRAQGRATALPSGWQAETPIDKGRMVCYSEGTDEQ